LDRAQRAVSELKPSDIVEMKTNKNPGPIIKYIMDSVCVFFQAKLVPIQVEEKEINKKNITFIKDSYEEVGGGRAVLNDNRFMQSLVGFEKDAINDETVELLEPYIQRQDEWFNEDVGKKASVAAAGILRWALAINEYNEKSKIVKPKKIFLQIQEGRLQVAQKELAKAQEELQEIQKLLADLKEKFSKQMEAKNVLEQKALKTKKKITTARQLI
jgi:dynein heavy chain